MGGELDGDHAALFCGRRLVERRKAQSTPGNSSSQVTCPPVARSIFGQCSAGTGRTPVRHWLMTAAGTLMSFANAAAVFSSRSR